MSFAAAAALSGIASIGNTMLSQYYNKKNMRDQANLQYLYAERYAKNSPSWNVQGLRDAGLNPILSVSNGVNFGANIPNITNSSPESKIDIPAVEALKASKDVDIGQQNANSNSDNSVANLMQGQAALMRAESQNKVDAANVALKTIEAEKARGSRFDTPIMRDAEKIMNRILDSSSDFTSPLVDKLGKKLSQYDELSYLRNSPKPLETRTEYQLRQLENKPLENNPLYYRSNRSKKDGIQMYRRRREYSPGGLSIFR